MCLYVYVFMHVLVCMCVCISSHSTQYSNTELIYFSSNRHAQKHIELFYRQKCRGRYLFLHCQYTKGLSIQINIESKDFFLNQGQENLVKHFNSELIKYVINPLKFPQIYL